MSKKMRFRRKKQTELSRDEISPFILHHRKKSYNEPFFSDHTTAQPKLHFGKKGDPKEIQADSFADTVLKNSTIQKTTEEDSSSKIIQSQNEDNEMQARLQMQKEDEIQSKLQNKEEEKEIQTMLQKQNEDDIQSMMQEKEDEQTQTKLQKNDEEEAVQPNPSLQKEESSDLFSRKASDKEELKELRNIATPSIDFETRVNTLKSGGCALSDEVRTEMEHHFGVSFSNVRIHTDDEAAQLCEEIHAQAFTQGYHVFFNREKFRPECPEGKHLLAHELTHVVQQNGVHG